MRKILMMAAYILLTLQCVGVYAGGKLPLEYGTKNLVNLVISQNFTS